MKKTIIVLAIFIAIACYLVYLFKDLLFKYEQVVISSGDYVENKIDWEKYFLENNFDVENYAKLSINDDSILDRFEFPEGVENDIVYKAGKLLLDNKDFLVYYLKSRINVAENNEYDGVYNDEYLLISNDKKNMKIIVNTDKPWIVYYKMLFVFKDKYIVLMSENFNKDNEQNITIYDQYLTKVTKIDGNINKTIQDPLRYNRNYYVCVGDDYIVYTNVENDEEVSYMLVESDGYFYSKVISRKSVNE